MKKIITLIFILITLQIQAQTNTNDTIRKSVDLDEIVISVNKTEEIKRHSSSQIHVISSKQIKFDNPQTSADLISNTGQIMVQKSQQGGGSPVIRGFEANKILLVVDGVRMNNLIYRGGHLQNVITVDPNICERVEVVFGPSSTIYGSDALGGSIHFITRKPEYRNANNKETSIGFMQRFSSVNKGLSSNLNFIFRFKKLATLTSLTYNQFGDLKMGKKKNIFFDSIFGLRRVYAERINGKDSSIINSNKYVQAQSGYNQIDLLQKFVFKTGKNAEHTVNLQYSNSSNVPRYDRLSEVKNGKPKFAEWYYGPQTRLLMSYNLNLKPIFGFDLMNLNISQQMVKESRINRNLDSNNLYSRLEEVGVTGANLYFQKNIKKHKILIGYDAQFNTLKSTANRSNIVSKSISPLDTRYPDGKNLLNNNSVFVAHTWYASNKITLNDGIRAGFSKLESEINDNSFFNLPVTKMVQKNKPISGNFGVVYNPFNNFKTSYQFSTGYRIPNIDDLSKIFESADGALIIPNSDLKPEYTITNEIGFSYKPTRNIRIETALWYTNYFNAIITSTTTLNGKDSVLYNSVMSQVLTNKNTQKAYINGVSVSVNANVSKYVQVFANFCTMKGRVTTDGAEQPLDHISPFTGNLGASYSVNKITTEAIVNFNGKKALSQYSSSGEDNLKYATPIGMPAWVIASVRAGYKINKMFAVQAGCENIFDTNYRVFSSGINAPGRNFYFTLRFNY
ncbi:MAG: TonB-dependent receptor [Bacteroidetes bacterium]|nr:TonB-dependent receptor [Bacteroidota bacterium]